MVVSGLRAVPRRAGGDRRRAPRASESAAAAFVKPLKDYRFPVVELPSDTSLEAVCQIFETLNKTGMKLTVFDLLTAKFWPQGIKLRDCSRRAREEFPLLGHEEFEVEATFLLQAIALLRSGVCKRGDLLQLSSRGLRGRLVERLSWRLGGSLDAQRRVRRAHAQLAGLRSALPLALRRWRPRCSSCRGPRRAQAGRSLGAGSGARASAGAMTARRTR